MDKSYGQMFQDLIVLEHLNWLENGIYVEIGALDGISHSNTMLLEQHFNWNGILVEPNPQFSSHLKKNRGNNHLDFSAVSSRSGQRLKLLIAKNKGHSTLSEFTNDASIYEDEFEVDSISLNDLLRKYLLPVKINYLSIDTEGGELAILESFTFKDFAIDFISVEHNHSHERQAIFELLTRHGFKRVLRNISSVDDWYTSDS
jgi:FkbM family methyltransferase